MSRTTGIVTLHQRKRTTRSESGADMYSDRIASNGSLNSRKRSVKDRLGTNVSKEDEYSRQFYSKRFQGYDGKWQHDMYDEVDNRSTSKSEQISTLDLRSKLTKSAPRASQGSSITVGAVKDLREKLSGPTPPIQASAQTVSMPQQGRSSSASKVAAPRPVATTISGSKPATVKQSTAQKLASGSEPMNISSFLESLGLDKYAIIFQAEEIDMSILRVMKDEELKDLGLPMGPRKKITLALDAEFKR